MRSLLLYLLLVGAPLAGVFGVLHLGSRLTPPPALGGAWRIEAAPADTAACDAPLGTFRIEQSGRQARVVLGEAATTATVEGARLRTQTPLAIGTGCSGWHLEAEGDGTVPDGLTGTFDPVGCACASVSFSAERSPVDAPADLH